MKGIIGSVLGDIIGSWYESRETSTKDYNFNLYNKGMRITDDTIHTCAICDWLLTTDRSIESCKNKILAWSLSYRFAGYGPMFLHWLTRYNYFQPYNSFGNGSAMRVSPVAWAAESLDECLELAERSAMPTHNHPEGVKGAQVVAGIAWCYRNGMSKDDILNMDFVRKSGYDLSHSYDDIHKVHTFDCTCQGSVPEAIICWRESDSYEDCIRKAIALGGDADTLGAIAGGMSAAKDEVPDDMVREVWKYGCCLVDDVVDVLNRFYEKFINPKLDL